jgi:prepilin-type N-terminal cleavage/methylation domain-containing protein
MISPRTQQKKGFTLIEVVIAIGILATSLTAAMSLVQRGYRATFIARDQVTAFYLAQDAIEQIRVFRNTNKLNNRIGTVIYASNYWLSGLDGSSGSPYCISTNGSAHCKIDDFDNKGDYDPSVSVCTSVVGPPCSGDPFLYAPVLGLYGYRLNSALGSARVTSRFYRDISIVSPVNGDANEAKVIVKVTWTISTGVTKSVIITEFMKNL